MAIAQFQIINKILQNKDMSIITMNNLTDKHFFNYKAEYTYIKNHHATYNSVPDRLTFQNVFPEFQIVDVNEPDNYLLSQLFEEYNEAYLATSFNNVKKYLENGNVDQAMEFYKSALTGLQTGSAMTAVNLIKDRSRFEHYLDMGANRSKYFISTGFKELDAITGGIDLRNEVMVISARTGVGKSWVLATMAAWSSKQGLKVGIYSGEMSADKLGYRIDTILGNVDNKRISRGDLAYKDFYNSYMDSLETSGYGDIHVITPADIAGPATVDALQAFVEKYHLDILYIDQYSLLEDTSRTTVMHERVANISKAIKNLQVKKQIPIISVAQMNRSKNEDKDKDGKSQQDTTQIGLSDRIGQDATVLIMLDKKEATSDDDEKTPLEGVYNFTLNLVKSRDGGDGRKLTYAWDLNNGTYNYIPSDYEKKTKSKDLDAIAASYEQPSF